MNILQSPCQSIKRLRSIKTPSTRKFWSRAGGSNVVNKRRFFQTLPAERLHNAAEVFALDGHQRRADRVPGCIRVAILALDPQNQRLQPVRLQHDWP